MYVCVAVVGFVDILVLLMIYPCGNAPWLCCCLALLKEVADEAMMNDAMFLGQVFQYVFV